MKRNMVKKGDSGMISLIRNPNTGLTKICVSCHAEVALSGVRALFGGSEGQAIKLVQSYEVNDARNEKKILLRHLLEITPQGKTYALRSTDWFRLTDKELAEIDSYMDEDI